MVKASLPGIDRPRRARRPKWTGSLAVVHVDTSRCPTCGSATTDVGFAQPALFYFGGYGATILRTVRRCTRCGWALPPEERSVSPRDRAV